MLHYKKYQTSEQSLGKGKWYARAISNELVDIDGLAKHMAAHNTPYSEGCIRGVLHDMADCIKELLLDGKNVKLDQLAIFSVSLQTTGADTAEAFTVAKNIKGIKLNARATGSLTSLSKDITLKEATEYTKETTAGSDSDTPTDGGNAGSDQTQTGGNTTPSGSGSNSGMD